MRVSARDWLAAATRDLGRILPDADAAREARLILRAATGWSAARTATAGAEILPPAAGKIAAQSLARRLSREPLAQILGHWPFYGRDFRVSRDVLTPRPDTETLVDAALAAPFARLIDLGTGSGAIAVTLLAEHPTATGLATDISAAALAIAAQNAAQHAVADRLALVQGSWWEAVTPDTHADLLVSNPPYVTAAAYRDLAPEITRFEPVAALTPGGDGLAAYRALLAGPGGRGLGTVLTPGARVIVEIGADQGAPVADLFSAAGLAQVTPRPDINGKDRIVTGHWPG